MKLRTTSCSSSAKYSPVNSTQWHSYVHTNARDDLLVAQLPAGHSGFLLRPHGAVVTDTSPLSFLEEELQNASL